MSILELAGSFLNTGKENPMSIRHYINVVEGLIGEAGWWPSRKQATSPTPASGPPVGAITKARPTSTVTTVNKTESSEAITQLKQAAYNVRTRRSLDQNIDAVEYYAKILRKMALDHGMGQFVPMLDAILADPENADAVDRFTSAFDNLMKTDADFHHTEYHRKPV